ncbi:MAG: hypothetical protein CMD72_04530 [Gammaproteobacteria bacterium]|nr:hypothetical protein [Gammaproteobacteria bacterium]
MNLNNLVSGLICLLFLNCCTGFKPIYKNNLKQLYTLQDFVLITDESPVSKKIKKELVKLLPKKRNKLYILKIVGATQSLGIVSDSNRRISRYKIETTAKIKIYQRKKNVDKLIYDFSDKQIAPYSLISNNVRSTLAGRKKAEDITIRLISNSIYKRLLIFMTKGK